jgi:2-methylaconitate cis-trans-isomerase PrpF
MRAGTSRGPFFLRSDLPSDESARNRVLIAAIGSPHPLHIDGLGGANPLSSKVAIVSRSRRPGFDVDYLFVQVDPARARVDTSPSCGNMAAGVGPFAILRGLVPPSSPVTRVRIFAENTGDRIVADIPMEGLYWRYDGDVSIDGVDGSGSGIELHYTGLTGGTTGSLYPTGGVVDVIDGIRLTCIDAGMPVAIAAACDLGVSGSEEPEVLDANKLLLGDIERLRITSGYRMGIADPASKVIPKFLLVSSPTAGGTICSRYFTPTTCHRAHATTGAVALAAACLNSRSVPAAFAKLEPACSDGRRKIVIEHPSGILSLFVRTCGDGVTASLQRTARPLLDGQLYLPEWAIAKTVKRPEEGEVSKRPRGRGPARPSQLSL